MTSPVGPILEARALIKTYEQGQIQALSGLDLSISAGDSVSITGPSGSGKSTLLHLLGGLDTATAGQVLYRGRGLGAELDLAAYRCRHVGFVFQAFHLIPTLTALENVQVPMLALSQNDRLGRARRLLESVAMEHRLGQFPSQLSAGERQRVAIARALANGPEILLADEPTGNLDTANAARIVELLARIQAERGTTLVLVTHEAEVARSARRQIRMRDGRIEADE